MGTRSVVIATHGHCFDGMASAALFMHLLRTLRAPDTLSVKYRSCGYGPNMSTLPEEWLEGEENAILDFRYTASKRLSWYFDHHVTAFASPEQEQQVLRDAGTGTPPSAPRVFYDPAYSSCTKLIADVARDRFAVPSDRLTELVAWADTIDAARFASAEAAVDRTEPVLQLASVVEHHGDGRFLTAVVPRLLEQSLHDVATSPETQELWAPLRTSQDQFRARVERRATIEGDVVFVDLTDAQLEVAAKFVTYALYPRSAYSVMISRSKTHCKVSVGHNPWGGKPRRHDIAAICRRAGGGGHPAVGAASFPLSEVERALTWARGVADELNR